MKVPLLDLKAQYQTIKPEIDSAVQNVLDSQIGILGPEVKNLESEIIKYCESKYAIGVASGTDALLLALMAWGVGPETGVITTPFTFFATVGSIDRLGARTFFVDIQPDTFNIDPKKIESFLNSECAIEGSKTIHKKTKTWIKAIIPVHLYGQCADMDGIMKIAKKWNISVLEDTCQSIGATFNGQQAGTYGEFGSLSFFPSKNLGGLGDGGMILAQTEKGAHDVRILRVHGSEPKYFHKVVGANSRLDALQAAILRVKLKHLSNWTEGRRKNAKFYDEAFKEINEITPPKTDSRNSHVYNQYCIRTEKRDALRNYLAEKEIGSEIYYPLSLHQQECFLKFGYKTGDFPESEKAAKEVLALPIFAELTPEQLAHVSNSVKKFFAKKAVSS